MQLPLASSPIEQYLRHLHGKFARLEDGAVATYIPELGRAQPGWFGIAVATVDGQVYEVGDSRISSLQEKLNARHPRPGVAFFPR